MSKVIAGSSMARQIVGDKDVVVGAPSVTWRRLQPGLLDAIHIDLAPVGAAGGSRRGLVIMRRSASPTGGQGRRRGGR